MAHAQKPDFAFRRNGRVHLNRRGNQFSRLLAGELYTSACRVCTARANLSSAGMWRLLATHSILQFPLHFSSRASPCAITFQTQSTTTHPPPFAAEYRKINQGQMPQVAKSCTSVLRNEFLDKYSVHLFHWGASPSTSIAPVMLRLPYANMLHPLPTCCLDTTSLPWSSTSSRWLWATDNSRAHKYKSLDSEARKVFQVGRRAAMPQLCSIHS
jgi:hypothetical protein